MVRLPPVPAERHEIGIDVDVLFGAVPHRQLDASLDAVAHQQESHGIRRGRDRQARRGRGEDPAALPARAVVSMDVNGDNKAGLVAIRTSDNTLWQWLGTGNGGFVTGTQVGSGWTGWTLAAN